MTAKQLHALWERERKTLEEMQSSNNLVDMPAWEYHEMLGRQEGRAELAHQLFIQAEKKALKRVKA